MSDKKRKASKFNPVLIIYMIIGGAVGFFGADVIDKLINVNKYNGIIVTLFLMIVFCLSFYLSTIIHESGHLVMGLLTGYEFVSFRVGNFTIVKENGKLVRRKFNIAGTGGQCILTHKTVDNPQDIPYFWYHFGGVFFNFLTMLVCIPVILIADNPFIRLGFVLLAFVSLILGIMNITPTKAMGVGTDGYNLLLLKKSPVDRVVIYKTSVINAMQYQGIRLEDIPDEILTFTDEEKECVLGVAATIIEANVLMNRHDFKSAEEIYTEVADNENNAGLYRNECKCEKMFCMIMNGCSKEEIDGVYDKELKKYIKVTENTYISRKRLLYAYYLIIEKDNEKAEREYNLAKKMESTYPAKGEYLSEMALIEYVKNTMQEERVPLMD